MRIAAPAERGRANEALLELLAGTLSVPRSRIRLVAGAGSRDKVIEVQGLRREEVDQLLTGRQRKGKA